MDNSITENTAKPRHVNNTLVDNLSTCAPKDEGRGIATRRVERCRVVREHEVIATKAEARSVHNPISSHGNESNELRALLRVPQKQTSACLWFVIAS